MIRLITKFTTMLLMSLPALGADWDPTRRQPESIPASIEQLQGAFRGEGLKSGDTAYVLVYLILEEGQPSGRFNIFLLSNDRRKGQVFEGEVIGLNRIALMSIGTTADNENLKTITPPSGTLEVTVDRRGRKALKITALNNVLTESYLFDDVSKDIRLGPVLPRGTFTSRGGALTAVATTHESAALNGEIPALSLKGVFYTVFELTGLMVMRSEHIDSSLNVYGESSITGVLVSIYDGRKESIIVGKASVDGEPVNVEILRAR